AAHETLNVTSADVAAESRQFSRHFVDIEIRWMLAEKQFEQLAPVLRGRIGNFDPLLKPRQKCVIDELWFVRSREHKDVSLVLFHPVHLSEKLVHDLRSELVRHGAAALWDARIHFIDE